VGRYVFPWDATRTSRSSSNSLGEASPGKAKPTRRDLSSGTPCFVCDWSKSVDYTRMWFPWTAFHETDQDRWRVESL